MKQKEDNMKHEDEVTKKMKHKEERKRKIR
jgi:hypothetical protein